MTDLVVARKEGLFYVPGRFYIKPWRPVERANITHAHADHARSTDREIAQVDAVIRKTTVEKFGPVRSVTPTMVFEIGFEGIAPSARHKAGIAVRFPRMLCVRDDKEVGEADTVETLKGMLT